MKCNSFVYGFKGTQIIIILMIVLILAHETTVDGGKFFDALFCRLVNMMFNGMAKLTMTVDSFYVFYEQRDLLHHLPWAFGFSY